MRKYLNPKNPLTHLLIVILVNTILLSFQVKKESGRSLFSSAVLTITTPMQSAFDFSLEWLGDKWNEYFYIRNSNLENARLRKEITRLRHELALSGHKDEQIKKLEKLLRFHRNVKYRNEPAQLIGLSPSKQNRVIFINKGSRAGVQQFQPVITEGGVAGIILNTTPFTSQVLLVNDGNSAVSVITEKSRERGIAYGYNEDTLEVEYIHKRAIVEKGERLLTSGLDGIFPPDLEVGTITEIRNKDELFLEVLAKPAVDLRHLETMVVLIKDIRPLEIRYEAETPEELSDEEVPDKQARETDTENKKKPSQKIEKQEEKKDSSVKPEIQSPPANADETKTDEKMDDTSKEAEQQTEKAEETKTENNKKKDDTSKQNNDDTNSDDSDNEEEE